MQPNRITPDEKARLTDSACHLFMARNPDYWPSTANSERLIQFVQSQLGQTLDEVPFPILIDQWQAAYDHLKKVSWFYPRPVEEEVEDAAVVKERNTQQKIRDDFDARQRAEQIQRDKNIPLKELGAKVSQQNSDFRRQREQNLLPTRTPGLESRNVEQVQLGIAALARVNVGLARPELSPKSGEFSKLCAAEVVRLRSQQ